MAENTQPNGGPKEEKRKRRPLGWLWRGYRTYDTWSGRYGWLNWLFGGGKAATAVLVGAGAAVTAAGVGLYVASRPEPPQALVTVTPQATDTSILFPIEGRDKAGRLGKFDVVVLTKKYGWVRKSTDQLTREGTVLAGPDVLAQIFDDQVRASFDKSIAVIAAGVASQEGEAQAETERANARAKKSAEWLAPVVAPNMPIWTLNLGQYKQPCPDCAASGTDWQRPLIVVAVRELEPNADMGEALADALRGKTNLPSPESYSAYALTKFR